MSNPPPGYPNYPPNYPPEKGADVGPTTGPAQQNGPPVGQQHYAQPMQPVQQVGVYGAPPICQTTTVVVQPGAQLAYLGPSLGTSTTPGTCPYCRATISTAVSHEAGTFTYIIAVVLCLVGCIPCCLIPFCVESMKDTVHSCPNCKQFIGKHSKM